MKCPTCGAWTEVVLTRWREDNTRRRVHQCGNLHKFSTVERIEEVEWGGARSRRSSADLTGRSSTTKKAGACTATKQNAGRGAQK